MENNPDGALGVRFFMKAFENKRESEKAGRPIYQDREMIEIIFPADNKRKLVAPANEMHYVSHHQAQMTYAERFKPIYEAWKANDADFVAGTPLVEAPFLTNAEREEMKAQKIFTIEQLAGLPDSALSRLGPGWRDRREKAEAYLKTADSTAEIAALKAEIERLKAAPVQTVEVADQFEDFSQEDLRNMAADAGLSPRANASRDALIKLLSEKAKEAA